LALGRVEAMSGDVKVMCDARNSEDAIQWAAENNLDIILPDNNQLLVDLDDYASQQAYERTIPLIAETYGLKDVTETVSRSGNLHRIVTLNTNISATERIALQAILGSDRRREAHSLRRLRQGEQNPTLFFEKR
jgi:hypothetical protein